MKRNTLVVSVPLGMGLISPSVPAASQMETSPYEFRYPTYRESTALLRELAQHYPRLAKLYSIGKSATGTKEISCIEVCNQETGAAEYKPATFLDRGILSRLGRGIFSGTRFVYTARAARDIDLRREQKLVSYYLAKAVDAARIVVRAVGEGKWALI